MSIHVCKCEHNGQTEYHLRYPGMSEEVAQGIASKINSGCLDRQPCPNVPGLECTAETVIKVDYSDLERYILGLTGKRIHIPAILECGNDTDHEIEIGTHHEWVDKSDREDIVEFLDGEAGDIPTYGLSDLMEVMCERGQLAKGTYLIRVSW